MVDFNEFLEAPTSHDEGFADAQLVNIRCRPDDSFSTLISRILHSLGLGHEDFSEHTASLLSSRVSKLILCLKDSHCLRGPVLQTLLEYWRPFVSECLMAFIVDSPVAIERLGAGVQYAGRFVRPEVRLGGTGPCMASDVLFRAFLEHLARAAYPHCILGPQVCGRLADLLAASSLPFVTTLRILRYCAFSLLQRSPLIALDCFSAPGVTTRLAREGLPTAALTAGLEKASPRQFLENNAALLEALIGLRSQARSRHDWLMEMLSAGPNFIASLALDPFFTGMERLSPDEAVQYLTRLDNRLAGLAPCGVAKALRESVCSLAEGSIRSREDVRGMVSAVKVVIAEAELLHVQHPLAPWLIYDDAEALESLFFADMAKTTMLALKTPGNYLRPSGPTAPSRKRIRGSNATIATLTPPDASRVYRLTLEWQRQVNLHDLYFQFQSQVHAGSRKVTAGEQAGYMARFQQAVNELQLAGLWAPMGRRRDTYERRNLCDSIADGYL